MVTSKIPEQLMVPDSDIISFNNEIIRKQAKLEEGILISVLRQYLGKEPAIEDFKKCKMVNQEGIHDRYGFCYNGTTLGIVVTSFEGYSFKVEFIPHDQSKQIATLYPENG